MPDGKKEYLQMLQEPISRMSTISSIFKGFSATIVAGIAMISYSTTNTIILALSFLPVVSFWALDIYYLKQERKFRYIYNLVRVDKHEIDFSMEFADPSSEKILAKATIWDCMKSPSIYLFYPFMILIIIVVIVLKIWEVI